MERDYIAVLNNEYDEYFLHPNANRPVLVIDSNGLDFVHKAEDLDWIDNRIRQAPRLLLFARLNAGVTPDQFMAALSTDQTGMAALALVSLLGGREVIPGASKSVTFDLKPGNYMVLDLSLIQISEPPTPYYSSYAVFCF